jgi:hypothetical protein
MVCPRAEHLLDRRVLMGESYQLYLATERINGMYEPMYQNVAVPQNDATAAENRRTSHKDKV